MKPINNLHLDYPYIALPDIDENTIESQAEEYFSMWDNITD